MCGICGIYTFDSDDRIRGGEWVGRMNDRLLHRGPDEGGFHVSGPIALGHRRLSIIDLATGKQPMSNEDGSVWLVFNGEIYNYRELRSELIQKGYRFLSHSDTEVIIHLYEDIGEGIFDRLNGMFAIGLWDAKKHKLILARDRLGKKPLYYQTNKHRLAFASELKALLVLPDLPARVNLDSLDQFLSYQYIPAPKTIFSDVLKLEPATFLVCEKGVVRKEKYWRIDFGRRYGGRREQATDDLNELLADAVKMRLESEVPLGAFLSGGVDSSAVVALMTRFTDRPVQTTSIGFSEASFNELDFARLVAGHFHTDHREHVLQANFIEHLPRVVYHLDEPFADASALPTYLLCQATRRRVTVALSGDGGDENFAGYEWYGAALGEEAWRKVMPAAWRSLAFSLAKNFLSPLCRGYARLENINQGLAAARARSLFCFIQDLKRDLYSAEFRGQLNGCDAYQSFLKTFPGDSSWPTLSRLQAFDFSSYLPEDILTKMDRMSMAHSLEVRAPLLDYRVVELAASFPPEWKLDESGGKAIFRNAVRSGLPPGVTERRKMGFSIPLGEWFRGKWRPLAEKMILGGRLLERGYFEPSAVRNLWEGHLRKRFWTIDLGPHLWSLLVLELWHRLFVDGESIDQLSAELQRGMEVETQ